MFKVNQFPLKIKCFVGRKHFCNGGKIARFFGVPRQITSCFHGDSCVNLGQRNSVGAPMKLVPEKQLRKKDLLHGLQIPPPQKFYTRLGSNFSSFQGDFPPRFLEPVLAGAEDFYGFSPKEKMTSSCYLTSVHKLQKLRIWQGNPGVARN